MRVTDFEMKAIIGRGHFGEVRVVREKATDAVFALKTLRKSDLLAQPDISFFQEERDIMTDGTSPWITKLHYAFQDSNNLYLVMEFHAGGDLLSLLSRHDDIFEEKMVKFYSAEMAVAINSLHDMGFLHRDIKPENILLDRSGHVKLADFGSAARLNESRKVSARLPVGTPDYVAPELLVSLNKGQGRTSYGVEVDWWSLGVCTYEMLFGATPFTNEQASMVSTYANIMDFKNTLRFPRESTVSSLAKDFIKNLLTDAKSRYGWNEIARHPFFYKVQWKTLRDKEAAYVPCLSSLDDTSHFDEVEKVERQPDLNMLKSQSEIKEQDSRFQNFDFIRDGGVLRKKDNELEADLATVTTFPSELNCNNSNALDTERRMDQPHSSPALCDRDSPAWAQEQEAIKVLEDLASHNKEINSIQDELLELRREEMKDTQTRLEAQLEKLTAQLISKDRQIATLQSTLDEAQTQTQGLKLKLDKEKRKSRDEQRMDLELLELRSETWQSLLEEKQSHVEDLTDRVRELEGLVEAYEDSEEQQDSQVTQLQHKLNTSLQDATSFTINNFHVSGSDQVAKVDLDDHHHSLCPMKKKLSLHVTIQAGRCSFVDNKTLKKLQELQGMVDKYAETARLWKQREEELQAAMTNLESENSLLKQKEGMGKKMKEGLMDKVATYQQEVEAQKTIIRELQETMKGYLSRTDTLSDAEKQLKEAQTSKLAIKSELLAVQEEAAKMRQMALSKASQMEDAIQKLEEQRKTAEEYKKRYDCQVEATEAKVGSLEEQLAKVTSDRQRLEGRESALTTEVETLQAKLEESVAEVEKLQRRNTDIQSHLQQLQQRNSNLQVEVESLQKMSAHSDREEQSKVELNLKLNRLRQQNTDTERLLTCAQRDKQMMNDKVALADRERERLMRRIERLEAVETEKRELETKVEKMSALERENRRMERKIEHIASLEKEKLRQEDKLEQMQMDLRREKINIETISAEKKELELKVKNLQDKAASAKDGEVTHLTMKVTLLETVEKEKGKLEEEVKKLREETKRFQEEKESLENEKLKTESQRDKIQKEKMFVESKLEGLQKEKTSVDGQLNTVASRLNHLEMEKSSKERESLVKTGLVDRLQREKADLQRRVDELEKSSKEKESLVNNGLIDRLRKEKDDLQRQVDCLEKLKADMESRQQTRLLGRVSEVKVRELEAELREVKAKLKTSEEESERKMKKKNEEINKTDNARQEQLTSATSELEESRKMVQELQLKLEEQTANMAELRTQVDEQQEIETDLVNQLEKEAQKVKAAREEKDALTAQLKAKVEEVSSRGPQRTVSEAIAKDRQLAQVTQEKNELELKVSQLQKQVSQFKTNPVSTVKVGEAKFEKIQQEAKIHELTEERDQLLEKLKKTSINGQAPNSELSAKVIDLQKQLEETRRELEIRKGAHEFPSGDIPAYLRHELNESNLALSEARSLLSASKRQELELRDRIDKLQRIIDNKAVENGQYLQTKQDAISELKTLQAQHDTLNKQYQVLTDKCANQSEPQGQPEIARLKEEIKVKDQQLDKECKKGEGLVKVCKELEHQVMDMEAALAEAEKKQADWTKISSETSSAQVSSMRQEIDSMTAQHQAQVEKLNKQLRDETNRVNKLAAKVCEMEEREKTSNVVLENQDRETDRQKQERMKLKSELTELLSDNCSLRQENVMLNKHLQQAMDKFEIIIGEKVNLENFTEALQGLHFLDKYKFESTIGQQQKLIDYLQGLYMEHTSKKKKSGKVPGSLPLTWTDQQTALEQERAKSALLQDQVERMREENFQQANEMLKLRTVTREVEEEKERDSKHSATLDRSSKPDRIQANLIVKMTPSAVQALSHPQNSQPAHTGLGGSTTSLASNASSSSSASSSSVPKTPRTPRSHRRNVADGRAPLAPELMPTPQRMHHNIPHRFATGLNTRAVKCGLCLGSVYFVKQASKCQECGMVVHPKCAQFVPATCGLPTEYMRHFALMLNKIHMDENELRLAVDESAVKMEGWLKVPRLGKAGWENRYCVLEGTWLSLYLDERDANPVDSFDLNPVDADVSIHSAITSSELSTTAKSDLYYVLRLDQDPLTTCWPGRYLYLMTTNFQEKQRWVASLEAVVKSAQCKSDLYRNRSQITTVISLKDHERREFNCSLVISAQLVLVGTDDGLYAFNPSALTSKHKQMTQLSGFGSVHQMALAKGVDLIIILTGPERRLVLVENKLVKSRMSQTLGGETTPFSVHTIQGLQLCTIFHVGLWNNASYLCVGTPTKIYMMKYNPSLATYCVRKEFPSSEPCSCVCIADNYAIVGTERFYKISLEHPSMLDFVDRQDSSLAFAAYGAANHSSFPLAVVRVSPEDLPLEFLLCFHEFGVFVDHHGQRSRATDVKWSGLPLAFGFVDPFLYVTYCNTVQATVIPTDRTEAKGRQTVIDIQSPRYLGPAPSPGCAYFGSSNSTSNVVEIVSVQGQENFTSESGSDKENMGSTRSLATDRQVHYSSPAKTPAIKRLRRRGSLTSLNSNSSGSTFVSVESDV